MNKEEIIRRLKKIAKHAVHTVGELPFIISLDDGIALDEAVRLLEEQKVVAPINSYGTFRCGNCRNIVGYNDGHGRGYKNNFCSKCGKQVKWDGREK